MIIRSHLLKARSTGSYVVVFSSLDCPSVLFDLSLKLHRGVCFICDEMDIQLDICYKSASLLGNKHLLEIYSDSRVIIDEIMARVLNISSIKLDIDLDFWLAPDTEIVDGK